MTEINIEMAVDNKPPVLENHPLPGVASNDTIQSKEVLQNAFTERISTNKTPPQTEDEKIPTAVWIDVFGAIKRSIYVIFIKL